MFNRTHVAFKAQDRSYFAFLKKEIQALTELTAFSDRKLGEINIVVAEMVSNLVKHGGGGTLLVKLIEKNGLQGIELISVDNGVGMTDISRMVVDGVSTKNSLGHGLGAIKRLSDLFQIYSRRDWGTIVLARIFDHDVPYLHRKFSAEIESVLLAKPGEKECGDGFFQIITEDHVKIFLGDGLGHGIEASKVVLQAGQAFTECEEMDVINIIRYIDEAVKKTRGLVGTVAVFDRRKRSWSICGVGNIISRMVDQTGVKNYLTFNGIIGLNVPRTLNGHEILHEDGQILLMSSDGLQNRWDPAKYPSILRYDNSIFAAALIKDYAKNTDDVAVAVCKINL